MTQQQNRTRRQGSPTGAFPSIQEPATLHEPPAPRDLPDVANIPGGTGLFPIVAEGHDITREQDDSASANAPDADAPARR